MIWAQTLTAPYYIDLINPDPKQIHFPTIAKVLSRIPRFAGHTTEGTYSVAQHCEQGARAILRDTGDKLAAAAFLLHDAHEAYIGDTSRPVVEALARLAGTALGDCTVRHAFTELKRRIDSAIYKAAQLDALLNTTWKLVQSYDLRMMRTERDARCMPPPFAWVPEVENAEPVEGCDLYPWSEGTTEALYLAALREMLTVHVD